MKTLLAAAAAVALLGAASAASAENYASIGYSQLSGDDVDLGSVTGRLGMNVNQWFGVEGEVSLGVKDDTVSGTPAVNVKLKDQAGLFAVGRWPVGEGFNVLARVGYATTKIKASSGSTSNSDNEDGVAYGVGAQYDMGANGVRLDYTKFDFGSGNGDADAWTLSYVRKF